MVNLVPGGFIVFLTVLCTAMSDDFPLAERVALVTGASSGIGAATARHLAADGAHVVLTARREDRLNALADEIRTETDTDVLVYPADVTDPNAVSALVDATLDTFDRLDIVVANAGLGINADVPNMSIETYRTMTDVNVDGTFFTARATADPLRETDGNLVFVSSFSGQYPRPQNPVYAATKWWVRGFALSLEASLGADGVAVTHVNPTEVRTEFGSEDGDAVKDDYEPGAVTEPEEIAEAIAFAVEQRPPNVVSQIDLYRRDKMSHF